MRRPYGTCHCFRLKCSVTPAMAASGNRESHESGDRWRESCNTRFEVVLSFVIIVVQCVIETQVQFDRPVDSLCYSGVEHGETGRDDRRIVAVQAVMIDRAHSQG